jgi:hypothetical protein
MSSRLLDHSTAARMVGCPSAESFRVWLWRWNKRYPDFAVAKTRAGRCGMVDGGQLVNALVHRKKLKTLEVFK